LEYSEMLEEKDPSAALVMIKQQQKIIITRSIAWRDER